MANEVIYIPYGQDEISQQDLMTSLADGIESYLGSKRWAKKEKNRNAWLNAYLNILNSGLVGASNDKGYWEIQYNGDLDLSNLSEKDKEFYQDAAYYIQSKMAGITPKSKLEEETKKEKTKYDNKAFQEGLLQHISESRYGGKGLKDWITDWRDQDKDSLKDGIYGTAHRQAALAQYLKEYRDNLKSDDYDFESGPYKSKDEWSARVDRAIAALNNSEWNLEDIDALNQLGIDRSTLFYTGADDLIPYTDAQGNQRTVTRAEYNDLIRKDNEAKAAAELKAKLQLLLAQKANQYTNYQYYDWSKLNGTPLTAEESNLKALNNIVAKSLLDGNDASKLVYAFKLAEKNRQLVPLSSEERKLFGARWKGRTQHLRKINGLNGIYYDTLTKKYIKPYKQGQTSFLDILDNNNPENKQAQIKSQLVKQMNLPIQGSLNLSDLSNFGFDEATGNELWAVINDIGAFADPEAISGTALALNAARLRDKNREGWSWERVLDWGTSALGGLPVIGDAASVIKAGSNLVKLANRSARVGSFIGMAFSAVNMPEAWDSIKKIYDKGITSMTPQDILNITYGLMGLLAGIKTINAVNARQKPQTATEYSIEIDGKKVKLPDQATANKVSAEYKSARNNTEASLKVVKMQEVRESAKKAGIKITDASKVTSGSGFLMGNYVSRKLGVSKSPVKSELVNTGKMTGGSAGGYYMPSWRRSFLNLEQKEIKNPLRKTFDWFLGRTPNKPTTTNMSNPEILTKKTWSEIEKEPSKWAWSEEAKDYREMLKGNFGHNPIQEGVHKIGDLTFDVDMPRPEANIGFVEVTFGNGSKQFILFDSQKKLLERVAKLIKENRVLKTSSGRVKVDTKKMGEILKSLKAKGLLKQGGQITPPLDVTIDNFFKNNNI